MNRRLPSLCLVLAPLLCLMAGCSYFHHNDAQAAPAPLRLVKLDSNVYNLADTGTDAYLKLGISLGVATPAAKDESGDAELKSVVHDTLVNLVTAETSAQLLTESGKAALKKAVLAEVRKRLPDAKVETVYFDDFLVQH